MLSPAWVAAFVVSVGLGLAGCSPSEGLNVPAKRPSLESVRDGGSSDRTDTQASKKERAPKERWACFYDPTFNRDWHDDVLCTKGSKSVRPYLRPKDRFVTQDEIMRAARKYGDKLNAGR